MNLIFKTVLKKAGMLCLSTLLFALCSVLIYMTKITGSVQRLPDTPELPAMTANPNLDEKTLEQLDGYWTVAVFGLDSRNGSVDKGNNADVQMLCSINRTTGDIRLVSVYRDTYLMNNTTRNTYGKLSWSYMDQGPAGNVAVLSTNLDIAIDDYAAFNWKSVADAINLLGGVDIELSKAEFYYINAFITETADITGLPSSHLEEYGMQHLDGVQAVSYMRLRKMDTDFNRTERQRTVISQVFDKAKKADLKTLIKVLETVLPQIGISMDQESLLEIARNINKYNISAATGFPFTYQQASLGKSGDCVIPNTLESNVKQLHSFLYNNEEYNCSDRVKEISRDIIKDAVRN